ncbi:hypothetical protein [Natrinema pallidum]|uniref:hypothetical protein n=1 Tax=Natrinema pallidum TaxID=69527 RepID=UPI0015863FE9|nr:hypothetical protein [Natrinema pallidum]
MNRVRFAGVGLAALGVAGYVVGTAVAYFGRAFSLTAVMVGIALIAIAESSGTGGET